MVPVGAFFWTWSLKNLDVGAYLDRRRYLTAFFHTLRFAHHHFKSSGNNEPPALLSVAAASSILVGLNYGASVALCENKSPYPHNAYPKVKPNWWLQFSTDVHGGLFWMLSGMRVVMYASVEDRLYVSIAAAAIVPTAQASLAIMKRVNASVIAKINRKSDVEYSSQHTFNYFPYRFF